MKDQGPDAFDLASTDGRSESDHLSQFEMSWQTGDRDLIERSLSASDPSEVPAILRLLIEAEIRLRREVGEKPRAEEYFGRFPGHRSLIEAIFAGEGDAGVSSDREPSGTGTSEEDHPLDSQSPTLINPESTQRGGGGQDGGHGEPGGGGQSSDDGSRYRILQYLNGGGLGAIYVALDLELNRRVALKQIRSDLADQRQARGRFLLEAEVIGKLEHPNIIPIYGKGSSRDGQLYYAMRLIQGEHLGDAIDRFHKGKPDRTRGEHELMFRGLLRRIIEVCNAIDYAHSRGILHRDIKPRNVMLDRFGETFVVDWGLAKVLGSAKDTDVDEIDLTSQFEAAGELDPTRMDKVLGTLRYMSPEQAAGKRGLIGPLSDVFSLGATFYCLLTGRSPYNGTGFVDLKQQAIQGDYIAPRKLRAEIPAPLESIGLKALKIDPESRYTSPRAMAEDIERWLADQPVSVHKYPITAKASRWVRHHRPQVAAAAALLINLTAALAYNNVAIRKEQTKTEAALVRAEENYALSSEILDKTIIRLHDQELPHVPRVGDFRREVADEAVKFKKRLLDQHPKDVQARRAYANACTLAANNHLVAGKMARFFEYYDEIIPIFQALIAEDPKVLNYQNALVWAQLSKADALRETGQIKLAIDLFRESLEKAERVHQGEPDSPYFLYTLARTKFLFGMSLMLIGEHETARVGFDSAIDLLTPVDRRTPNSDPFFEAFRRHLVYLHYYRGILALETNDPDKAMSAFRSAIERLDDWEKCPQAKKFEIDYCRAMILTEQGRCLASLPGSVEKARNSEEEASRLLKGLCDDFPHIPYYRIEYAWALINQGLARSRLGPDQQEAAVTDFERAIETLARVVQESPGIVRARGLLGGAKGGLGRILLDRGQRERATELLVQAIEHQRQCLVENAANPADQKALQEHIIALQRAGAAP